MGQVRARSEELWARRIAASAIDDGLRDAMYALMQRYYGNVSRAQFAQDLAGKTAALLLQDRDGLVGFTTLARYEFLHDGAPLQVVFSGDTIVERDYWGEQELARSWLGEIGRIAATCPALPLYWFLIAKGHRTYRYLSAFAEEFVPRRAGAADTAELVRLRDALALQKFGDSFDPQTGVVRFPEARGNLLSEWAEPSAREAALPDVAYFLKANPGYRAGDELACLCALSPANMRPLARRWFDAGRTDG